MFSFTAFALRRNIITCLAVGRCLPYPALGRQLLLSNTCVRRPSTTAHISSNVEVEPTLESKRFVVPKIGIQIRMMVLTLISFRWFHWLTRNMCSLWWCSSCIINCREDGEAEDSCPYIVSISPSKDIYPLSWPKSVIDCFCGVYSQMRGSHKLSNG